MIKAIREAGRIPVQRNTFYEPLRVLETAPTATEAEARSSKSKLFHLASLAGGWNATIGGTPSMGIPTVLLLHLLSPALASSSWWSMGWLR